MSELTLFLIRLAYLAILWIFVLSALSVIRSDMFGARIPEGARRIRDLEQHEPRGDVQREAGGGRVDLERVGRSAQESHALRRGQDLVEHEPVRSRLEAAEHEAPVPLDDA